jgi:hypothetical protein
MSAVKGALQAYGILNWNGSILLESNTRIKNLIFIVICIFFLNSCDKGYVEKDSRSYPTKDTYILLMSRSKEAS